MGAIKLARVLDHKGFKTVNSMDCVRVKGKHASAIRDLIKAIGSKHNHRTILEVNPENRTA